MLENFDFSILDDPEFKEDSVREEIISPLLNELGYSASKIPKITRSKNLTHPFVNIGSKKYEIKIIPDYLLTVNEDHRWILDAKAPSENITTGKNVEQAFSYAIHPDVRAFRYALCNGRELVVFDVSCAKPLFVFKLKNIITDFKIIEKFLSPLSFVKSYIFEFKPDLGLYFHKLFRNQDMIHIFASASLRAIAKVEHNLYTIGVVDEFGDDEYALSFDFDENLYQQLLNLLPAIQAKRIKESLSRQPYNIKIDSDVPIVGIESKLSQVVYSNEDEDYCPFIVEKFF